MHTKIEQILTNKLKIDSKKSNFTQQNDKSLKKKMLNFVHHLMQKKCVQMFFLIFSPHPIGHQTGLHL